MPEYSHEQRNLDTSPWWHQVIGERSFWLSVWDRDNGKAQLSVNDYWFKAQGFITREIVAIQTHGMLTWDEAVERWIETQDVPAR
jgi:hypothetical protein